MLVTSLNCDSFRGDADQNGSVFVECIQGIAQRCPVDEHGGGARRLCEKWFVVGVIGRDDGCCQSCFLSFDRKRFAVEAEMYLIEPSDLREQPANSCCGD